MPGSGPLNLMRNEKVLVLGDDTRIFLSVVRSLGRAGKEVHAVPLNWHSPALKSKYVKQIHYCPRYSDDPKAWCEAILELHRVHSFALILPCDDPWIIPLHSHRDRFVGLPIAIHDPAVMTPLFDKLSTRQMCGELGIPVAPGDCLAADNARDLITRFGLPLIIKSRRSYWIDQMDVMGKAVIVDSKEQLEDVLASLEDRSRYLVEGFFVGSGIGVSVIANDGKISQAFQHRRLREGRGGPSSYRISETLNPELYSACERISAQTRFTGVCMFEFRHNLLTRKWILIETNARLWGSLSLPVSLGVDFPRLLFDLIVHRQSHPSVTYARGIKSRNLVLDGYNLLTAIRDRKGSLASLAVECGAFLAQPLRWMTGRERSDTFVLDDFSPALWELAMLGRSVGQKIVRSRSSELKRRRSEQRGFQRAA
jgi:predicted ATP-grasp superfamily ATP-dependent carboligase